MRFESGKSKPLQRGAASIHYMRFDNLNNPSE